MPYPQCSPCAPSVRRGSTPRVLLRVHADVSGAGLVRVAVRSRAGTEVYEGDRLAVGPDGRGRTLVAFDLTQEETLAYEAGELVELQVKCKVGGSWVPVSGIARVAVGEVLDEQVV